MVYCVGLEKNRKERKRNEATYVGREQNGNEVAPNGEDFLGRKKIMQSLNLQGFRIVATVWDARQTPLRGVSQATDLSG